MASRISPSQLRSKLRQIEQQRRRAIDNYNRAARQYNQKLRQAVNTYNQAVRSHNSRVRAYRQRLQSELRKLQQSSRTTTHVTFRTSVQTMHEAYVRLEQRSQKKALGPAYDQVLDLSERETAQSLRVMNALTNDDADTEEDVNDLAESELTDELRQISPDLDARWRGAAFSLSPKNPDAARHFCTSVREIFTNIIEIKAPDTDVKAAIPNCQRTQHGKPTRRSKIQYILLRKGMADDAVEDFVDKDVDNILELFHTFNDATHGSAGKFSLHQLASIKKRVESGILFLAHLVS